MIGDPTRLGVSQISVTGGYGSEAQTAPRTWKHCTRRANSTVATQEWTICQAARMKSSCSSRVSRTRDFKATRTIPCLRSVAILSAGKTADQSTTPSPTPKESTSTCSNISALAKTSYSLSSRLHHLAIQLFRAMLAPSTNGSHTTGSETTSTATSSSSISTMS